MPHRLRRVIGVNIYNPRDGGTSQRFAQLDTRGAVMAVGPNGVGKTSFLRLIPLFFGALPSRILRGSGHTSMIRHVLPRADSAVAYEYERESDRDVRCVVMHASPDEALDAPIFHILEAPFEERFFLDSAGKFIARENFKAHVESLDVQVSIQMGLSDYRGVILNAVPVTKETQKFRRLAVQHSLAPGSLQGLEDIAAAMGPETISFQTLQAIVVDQVAMELTGDGKMVRELRKSAVDVDQWLQTYEHLAKLQSRKPDADKLAASCKDIEQIDGLMRELRRAADDLVASLSDKHKSEQRARGEAESAGQSRQEQLQQEADAAAEQERTARQRVRELAEDVQRIEERHGYFRQLADGRGAETLHAEQQQETEIRRQHDRLRGDLADLEKQAKGIVTSFNERREAVERRLRDALTGIAADERASERAYGENLRTLGEQEREELAELAPPPQLNELRNTVSALANSVAELRGEQRNLAPSQEALAAHEEARQRTNDARGVLEDAQGKLKDAEQAERETEKAQAKALAAHEQAERELAAAREQVAQLESQLRPPADSLLAFMRQASFPGREHVARALDPQLLLREDLKPEHFEGESAGVAGTIVPIGPLAVDLKEVATPEWLEAASTRQRLEAAVARAVAAEGRSRETAEALEATNGQHVIAQAALAQARSKALARADDLKRIARAEDEARRRLQEDKDRRATEIASRIDALSGQKEGAEQKVVDITAAHERTLQATRSAYAGRRQQALADREAAMERHGAARTMAQEEAVRDTRIIDSEERAQLSAAGVDTGKFEQIRQNLERAESRLNAIARWRQEVQAWIEFREGALRRLAGLQEQQRAADLQQAQAAATASAADEAQQRHVRELRDDLKTRDLLIQQIADDIARLETLLKQELLAIGEAPAGRVVQSWEPGDLVLRVSEERRKLMDARAQASTLEQSLRSLMRMRPGPVEDWLARQEGEIESLLQGVPDHLQVMQRGRLIGLWFGTGFQEVVQALNASLHGNLHAAKSFVAFLDTFDRKVHACNSDLQSELGRVKPFPSFRDLAVHIRSSVKELEYMPALQRMADMADSLAPVTRIVYGQARQLQMPSDEAVRNMRAFHELLKSEGGIRANLADLVRLECSITINGKHHRIASAEEFKKHASNGNTGMIVAMFLMGFAGVVRRGAKAPVRVTWITDETGRFDAANLQQFLRTLDENNIDVISAQPEANPATLDLFDTESRFGVNGRIDTVSIAVDTWSVIQEENHVAA